MKLNDKEVLVCTCEGTMAIDANALAKACGAKKGALDLASHLCRTQIEEFQRQAKGADSLLVACTQEAPLFLETLDEMAEDSPEIRFTLSLIHI